MSETSGTPSSGDVQPPAVESSPTPVVSYSTSAPTFPRINVVSWTALGRYWKGIVAFVVAVLGGALAQGLIVGAQAAWVTVIVGALATVGVVAKSNTPSG